MFFVNIKSKSRPEFYDNPKNNIVKQLVLTETKTYLYFIFVQCLLYNLYCAPSLYSGPVLSQNNVPVSSHENVPVPLHENS